MKQNISAWILVGTVIAAVSLTGCQKDSKPQRSTASDHSQHADEMHAATDQADELIVSFLRRTPRAGDSVELQLMVHDSAGRMVTAFEPTHTKLAHLIIVREGLDEFAHLHPIVDASGRLSATHTFPSAGKYHLFLDYKPVGKPAITARTNVVVAGDVQTAPALTPSVPGVHKGDGLQADVSLRAEETKAQIISFKIQDSAGSPVRDLQPYLGALGHLVVLGADASDYVHAHPLNTKAGDNNVEFEVHFPKPGVYKAWGQFQRDDRVITISAVLKAEEAAAHH